LCREVRGETGKPEPVNTLNWRITENIVKKGVPRFHGKHAAWELLFPRSALFLLISMWKTVLRVWSITLGNENIFIGLYSIR
jgi:hypothetical protein